MVTGVEGGNMVFVKVRETYDLHTVPNKMTVIGIHTPDASILKRNYPGLLMQCKAYRPVSANVRVACASLQALDPQGVGTEAGDVAPEDIFNPILYKAMSNLGMSQLEARINAMGNIVNPSVDINGKTATVDVDTVTNQADEFPIYYGLLANTHDWKHANPQAGLEMTDLRPLVYEMLYNVGDNSNSGAAVDVNFSAPDDAGLMVQNFVPVRSIRGNAKPMPFINCTVYSKTSNGGEAAIGFPFSDIPIANMEVQVPSLRVFVGCLVIAPSRLHSLYYRMVVEWTIEFSGIRPVSEITDWIGLGRIGSGQHYQNYSYEATKDAVAPDSPEIMDKDTCMVSANVDVNKVM